MKVFDLIISIVALIVSLCNLFITKKIAVVDRKTSIYMDTIVYLDKFKFIAQSTDLGLGDSLTKKVTDEWISEQILIAVNIDTRLHLVDNKKADIFWKIISKIFCANPYFDSDSYNILRTEIISELNS